MLHPGLAKFLTHRKNVHSLAEVMAARLFDLKQKEMDHVAVWLLINVTAHDVSKFGGDEFDVLVLGKEPERLMEVAKKHSRNNLHHPEFWGGIKAMPYVYRLEMVCDWCARSHENGENIWEWYESKAMERFSIRKDFPTDIMLTDLISWLVPRNK